MTPEVTLAKAAGSAALFDRVASVVRALEDDPNVRQVVVSQPLGEIVVVDRDYNHVALRVTT